LHLDTLLAYATVPNVADMGAVRQLRLVFRETFWRGRAGALRNSSVFVDMPITE